MNEENKILKQGLQAANGYYKSTLDLKINV